MDEDDAEVDAVIAENSRKALADVLGKDRRDRILAALYLIRQDAVSQVRQASIHIWKALVNNTPRTGMSLPPFSRYYILTSSSPVREILSSLIDQIVRLLANPGLDQREVPPYALFILYVRLTLDRRQQHVPWVNYAASWERRFWARSYLS